MDTTTREDIKSWFDAGNVNGNTHMIVVQDTFDYGCYAQYISATEQADVVSAITHLEAQPMVRIMEVYAYHLPFTFQVEYLRAMFLETDPEVDATSDLNISTPL